MDRRAALRIGGAALFLPALGGGRASAAAPYEITFNSNLITVGNSLIDQSVDMVHSFRVQQRGTGTLTSQSIPGAPMRWNWDHARNATTNARAALATGRHDVWMGVESVPFRHVQNDICDIDAWTDWYRLAIGNGVTRFFLFEAWHDLQSGKPDYQPEDRADPDTGIPWRDRIDFARRFWVGIVDHVNSRKRPGDPRMNMIPGGRMFGAIHDDIAAGRAPSGLRRIEDLFMDTIHPNTRGRYAMACVMYACIFRRVPAGLPARTQNIWGAPFDAIPPDEAAYFQKLAWKVALAEPHSGLTG